MKKYMYLIMGLMLLTAGACQKTGETPPTVTLTAGESETDRFTFTLNSTDATAVAYVVLDEGEAIPSAEEILESGIYTISTRATLAGNDGENRIVRGRFSGECPVEDLSDGVRYIYEDIDEEYEGVGAQIYDLMDWEMMAPYINSFNITAYNCPVDEAGYVAGAGYVLSLNLYSPLRPYGDMSAICGTYTVKSVIEDYAAYAGYIYGGVVYGTAVTYYGDDCTPKYLAPITGGSIEISESGDNYHIKLTDCVTNTGCKVIFDYEGPISPFNDGRTPTTEGSAAPVIATAGYAAAMTAPWTPGE